MPKQSFDERNKGQRCDEFFLGALTDFIPAERVMGFSDHQVSCVRNPIFEDFNMCGRLEYCHSKDSAEMLPLLRSLTVRTHAAQEQEDEKSGEWIDVPGTTSNDPSTIDEQDRLKHIASSMYCYDPTLNALMIIHPSVREGAVNLNTRLETTKAAALALAKIPEHQRRTLKITQLIPEIAQGVLEAHIRLRVIEESPQNPTRHEVIDPRQVGQSWFNLDDCGRFVCTMIGQSVGLWKHREPITVNTLTCSGCVTAAGQFKTLDSLKHATRDAYLSPTATALDQIKNLIVEYEARQMVEQTSQTAAASSSFFKSNYSAKLTLAKSIVNKGDALTIKDFTEEDFKLARSGRLGKLLHARLNELEVLRAHGRRPPNPVDL